jgi:hypothetical protein
MTYTEMSTTVPTLERCGNGYRTFRSDHLLTSTILLFVGLLVLV